MSLPLCTGTSFSPRRSPDSPPLTRAPPPPLGAHYTRPLADSRLRTSFNPRSLTTDIPSSSPPWKSHIPGWRRDFDDPLRPPSLRFPSSQGKIPRPPWNVRDNAKARLWINFVRGYEVLFLFFFFYFSLSFSLFAIVGRFLCRRGNVCWAWIVVAGYECTECLLFFLWFE